MQVQTQQPLAVIDYHAVTLEEHRPRENDRAPIYGVDRCSGGNGIIETLMPALHLLIENPLRAKNV